MERKQKTKVAIQGISTSFHEVAALNYFGDSITALECLSFHALCDCLKRGEADFAVMAIENSIAGSILPNYFLLQENQFSIVGELYVPIHMHLLGIPGAKLDDIKIIESHPMAIRQCSSFLYALPNVRLQEGEDTALAAKRVMEAQRKDFAAIANEHAARKFGLEVIQNRIETHPKNFTRFLVLSREQAFTPSRDKASLYFEVAHEVGCLADVLMIFKRGSLNLTKIQSIPIIGRPQEYSFHLDVEFSERSAYEESLQRARDQVRNLTVLGEYKKGKIEIN